MGSGLGSEVELAVVLGDVDHCDCCAAVGLEGEGRQEDESVVIYLAGDVGPSVAVDRWWPPWNGRVEGIRHRRQALPIRKGFKCFGLGRLIHRCNEGVIGWIPCVEGGHARHRARRSYALSQRTA